MKLQLLVFLFYYYWYEVYVKLISTTKQLLNNNFFNSYKLFTKQNKTFQTLLPNTSAYILLYKTWTLGTLWSIGLRGIFFITWPSRVPWGRRWTKILVFRWAGRGLCPTREKPRRQGLSIHQRVRCSSSFLSFHNTEKKEWIA